MVTHAEDHKFKASPDNNLVRPYLKTKNEKRLGIYLSGATLS